MLLHGFLSNSRYWQRLTSLLVAAGYRVVAIDLLGFGRARTARSRFDYDAHVAHLYRSLALLGVREPVTLIGHSMGALIAARYAVLHPGHVARVGLVNPPLYASGAEAHSTLRGTSRLYRMLLDSRRRHLVWTIAHRVLRTRIGRHTPHARDLSLRRVIETAEAFDDLARIRVPTLVVVGSRDRPEYARNLRDFEPQPNVRVKFLDGGHHVALQGPDALAAVLLPFLTA